MIRPANLTGATADTRGYSLLELLVSMLVVSLLLAGLYTVLFQAQTGFEHQELDMGLRQEGRIVLDQLAVEIRMAGFGSGNLPERITAAAADRLVFVADVDGGSAEPPCDAVAESATDGGAERIGYRLVGDEILRSVDCWNGSAWSNDSRDLPVAHNVGAAKPLFRYFDADDAELTPGAGGLSAAQRAAVRSIGVEIELEDPTDIPGQPPASFSLRTRVTLRNIDS